MQAWPDWLARLIVARSIDMVFLFGKRRRNPALTATVILERNSA
jgi:hypothetical protein